MSKIVGPWGKFAKKIILVEDYDHKGQVFPARENKMRAALHFLVPYSGLLTISVVLPKIVALSAGAAWVLYVVSKEGTEGVWQTKLKTRSDYITKLAGLAGLWGMFL